jgi:hypothetical protein
MFGSLPQSDKQTPVCHSSNYAAGLMVRVDVSSGKRQLRDVNRKNQRVVVDASLEKMLLKEPLRDDGRTWSASGMDRVGASHFPSLDLYWTSSRDQRVALRRVLWDRLQRSSCCMSPP